jgi:uncharacterized protein YdeI (YjbR/CyaY-like superfamily)
MEAEGAFRNIQTGDDEETMAEISTQLYMTNREDWRAWLEKHHDIEKEVWLIYYKKHTGKPTIPYDDAVEEALCYGWIDSLVKRIDDEKYTQKYTPRKKKSIWSKTNKKRVAKMIRQGRMTEAGLAKVRQAKENGEWDKAAGSVPDTLSIPPDLQHALAANPKALKNFQNFTSSYQKRYIVWITSAKREETRQKRIQETIRRAEQNKKPGME